MAKRITKNVRRSVQYTVWVDDVPVQAYAGETIAATLFAADLTSFYTTKKGLPRGPFCNMGTCFECTVEVRSGSDDEPGIETSTWVRACMTPVEDNLCIKTRRWPEAHGDTHDE